MNRKIFTLLASAILLLSTAFVGEAKILFGNRAVGDTVRTLPLGQTSKGMYHIRVDSLYVGEVRAQRASGFIGVNQTSNQINGTTSSNGIYGQTTPWTPDTLVLGLDQNKNVVITSMQTIRRATGTFIPRFAGNNVVRNC